MNVNIHTRTGKTIFRYSCDGTHKGEVTVNVKVPPKVNTHRTRWVKTLPFNPRLLSFMQLVQKLGNVDDAEVVRAIWAHDSREETSQVYVERLQHLRNLELQAQAQRRPTVEA